MVEIVQFPIDRQAVLDQIASHSSGALVTFDGRVRSQARGRQVRHLFYEAFSEMARQELSRIRQEAMQRWPLEAMAIVHRVGRLEIGESSVLIAVSSAHRQDAFEACRWAIDRLKTRVPIWKKEHYQDGSVWIESYSS